jgi:methionine-rich copper-binding protein CopC
MKVRRSLLRGGLLFVISSVFVLQSLPGVAQAHSELEKARPKAGSSLQSPPGHAYLDFSEAPSGDSVLEVFDGCGTNVVKKLEQFDITLHVLLRKGQPGDWRVKYDVISDKDGHESRGGYRFTVAGKKDCSHAAGRGGGTLAGDTSNGGSGFPWVPVAIGAIVLLGGTLVVRARTGGEG